MSTKRTRSKSNANTRAIKPTSLKLNPDLWDQVKIEAIRNHLTITDYVESALKDRLSKGVKK